MAWQDPNVVRGGDDDLMGAHGDALFADPLGIRKDKGRAAREEPGSLRNPRAPAPRAPQAAQDRPSSMDSLDELPERRQAEVQEEPQGPVGAWFSYIFGGGTQCCGNRPKDAELAKRASLNGRPPTKQFPDAPRSMDPPTRDLNHGVPPLRERDDPFATGKRSEGGGRKGGLDEPGKLTNSSSDPLRDSRGNLISPLLKKQEEEERRQSPRPQPKPVGSMDSVGDPQALMREKPPEGHLPRKWQWPPWTLNTKEAARAIEVYVTDEDTDESRWCEAEPQFRVVDKEGNDAYLCAEYNWDGEFYVQDFGPHHVRKRGQDMTVFQLFALDPSVVNSDDFMKDTMNKSVGRKNLDDTDPFMTTKPR